MKPTVRENFLDNLIHLGYPFKKDEPLPGREDIRAICVESGAYLIKGGSVSGFVYVPLEAGLRIYPLGGYESHRAKEWIPLGNTGVIRGAIRNADVVAEQEVSLLCLSKETYLKFWHHPVAPKQLAKRWKG